MIKMSLPPYYNEFLCSGWQRARSLSEAEKVSGSPGTDGPEKSKAAPTTTLAEHFSILLGMVHC